ncbi:MAG: phosphatase PAP2 family protein [Planctomycetota bacterium]
MQRQLTMRNYRLVDYLTQGYVLLVALLILLFHSGRLPLWPLYVAVHGAVLVAVHVLILIGGKSENGFVRMLRCFYPMILYTFLYTETNKLDGLFYHGYLDGFFIDLDQRLFGCQLSRTMMQTRPYLWVSEILYLFYFSYYVMVAAVGFALYFKDRRHFIRYVTVVSFVFYVCYLTYIFLPVMGPHGADSGVTFHGELASVGPRVVPEALKGGVFYNVMGVLYKLVEPQGGATFPSSHVAVAVATLWFTWTHFKKVRWLHLVAVIMLCVSTVYCGYHYAVDMLGGLAAAAVLVPLGELLHRKWGGAGPQQTTAGHA